jgi:hypothetical protein
MNPVAEIHKGIPATPEKHQTKKKSNPCLGR